MGPLLTVILSDDYLYKRVDPSSSVFIEISNTTVRVKYFGNNEGMIKEYQSSYKDFKQRLIQKYAHLEDDICSKQVDAEKESKKVKDAEVYIREFLRVHKFDKQPEEFLN